MNKNYSYEDNLCFVNGLHLSGLKQLQKCTNYSTR